MKSIRLSLIVYFLALLTIALGAISWFSYQTTAQSFQQNKLDSQKMIRTQFSVREKAASSELDRHLIRQARAMAGMQLVTVNYEAAHVATLVSTSVGSPVCGYLWLPAVEIPPPKEGVAPVRYTPIWVAQDKKLRDPSRDIFRFVPRYTHLQSSELLVSSDPDHPQEFFQTYRGGDGAVMQRSESLGDASFTLDRKWLQKTGVFSRPAWMPTLGVEEFDEVELRPGVTVRRVTLKTPVAGYGGVPFIPWKAPPLGTFGKGVKNPLPPPPRDTFTPTFFIQYAADMAPLQERIQRYASERDQQLANLEATINTDLDQLRSRMLWIGLFALGAIWLGGYGVIRLGLAPLSKMTEAVSQVSPQNFHLPLETEKLPDELQPIAERLQQALTHLRKAFDREKQAAADISHELRTPLAALMTTLEVGLKKNRSPDEYRELLEDCRASGQHMYHLVERLMKLARLDAGADQARRSRVDVADLAGQCADIVRPLAKARDLDLRVHAAEPIVASTDEDKLREVIISLLHNAIEYNKPRGSIDLAVERIGARACIQVRDTGIGIKPEAMEHIFERFFRADPSRHADTPHAGLGLSIVKSYIDLLGGSIRVESSEAGTTFFVELPGAEPAATNVQTTKFSELAPAR